MFQALLVKDPRTARLLPLWKGIFNDPGVQPIWLLAVRHPRAVANSLLIRDGIPLVTGELLWAELYLDALHHIGANIAGVIHYEQWFSSPREQFRERAIAIGGVSSDAIDVAARSIRAKLRHNVPAPGEHSLDLAQLVYLG